MDQQDAVVLGGDLAAFEAWISQLTSPANERRLPAEALFNLCRERHRDVLALKLAQVLHSSQSLEIRDMAAVLLRQLFYMWLRLTPATQSSIKSLLLSAVQREVTRSIAKKLCDIVSELVSNMLPDDTWPELLPFMFQAVTSDSLLLQISALLIFSQLKLYIGGILFPHHLPTLHLVFLNSLTNLALLDVRIAALKASINFVQCLESAADLELFEDLLPAMIRTLTEALNSGKEAQEALELLIELAGREPRFFMGQLADAVVSMLQNSEADRLEEGTRHLAVEFVFTLVEARERAPGSLFAVLMKMLLDIEDDLAWHFAKTEDEDAGETSNYSVGKEYLDRLSIVLGGNTIVPVAFELLPQYLAAPEWQNRHAALITIAQIAEGCSKVMVKNLDQVVFMVLNSSIDPHPRVRWAAINAIGQLCTYLGPGLQVHYHQQVFPALASAMNDVQNPRVQTHVASVVLNFIESCNEDTFLLYLSRVIGILFGLIRNGNQMVQEEALTALALVGNPSRGIETLCETGQDDQTIFNIFMRAMRRARRRVKRGTYIIMRRTIRWPFSWQSSHGIEILCQDDQAIFNIFMRAMRRAGRWLD